MKRENPPIEICPGITRRTVAHGKTMYQMMATRARRKTVSPTTVDLAGLLPVQQRRIS
jgi:hypothetical protein